MSDLTEDRLRDLAVDRDANARLAATALLEGDDKGARWYAERFQKFAAAHDAAHAELISENGRTVDRG